MNNPVGNRRGDTLVEVIVAFLILMMVLAAFQTAIALCGRIARQAGQRQEMRFLASAALRPQDGTAPPTEPDAAPAEDYLFLDGDGQPAFLVRDVRTRTATVTLPDGAGSYRFHLYDASTPETATPEAAATGGATP